jgi:rhamnosyltransferase
MNRILYFVHYNRYDGLAEYVLYLLEHIKHVYSRIVFVSNSSLSGEQNKKIAKLCDTVILRENKGFDFGAWKDALLRAGWDVLSEYDSLTLMNDTCFGPLFDLEQVYKKMEGQGADFWGLTNCQYTECGMPGTDGPIPEHIQSYFLCFNKNVIQSSEFQTFWNAVEYKTNVDEVIQEYETQLTGILRKAGFKYTNLYDTAIYSITIWHPNHANKHTDICIKNNVPFVKIKAFTEFSSPEYIIKLIQEKTAYPVSLIYDYFTELYPPNTSLLIEDKLVPALSYEAAPSSLKIAIHIHVYYLDIFEKYILLLNTIPFDFDVFITTDAITKQDAIKKMLQNQVISNKVKDIIITENKGRDILPWLHIKDRLGKYDVVGHFHTKKSAGVDEWTGIVWQQELLDLLLVSIAAVINTFNLDENIGIIIPDIPYYFSFIDPLHFPQETGIQDIMTKLWNRMGCNKQVDFKNMDTAIMPCRTMFWYRPKALRPLLQLQFADDEIPCEPLPPDVTILHCIERILVYIGWNEGYDYRIMVPATPQTSNFAHNMILNRELNAIRATREFKTGKIIKSCIRFFVPKDSRCSRFAGKIFRFGKRLFKKLLSMED